MPDSPLPAAGTDTRPAIFVAGSDARWRSQLRDWLEHEFAGHRCIEAAGREQLRRLLIQQRPALVLVDVDTHGLLALDLVRLVRTLAPRAVPVALSAYNADAYRDFAIGAGAATCVSPQALDGTFGVLLDSLLRAGADGGEGEGESGSAP